MTIKAVISGLGFAIGVYLMMVVVTGSMPPPIPLWGLPAAFVVAFASKFIWARLLPELEPGHDEAARPGSR